MLQLQEVSRRRSGLNITALLAAATAGLGDVRVGRVETDWRALASQLAARATGRAPRGGDVMVRGRGDGCGSESCTPPVACFPDRQFRQSFDAQGNPVDPCAPNGMRMNYVGGVSLALAAATAVDVTITLRQEFKGMYLIIPSAIAGSLTVNSVKIGNIEQLGGGAIPGFVFSSDQENGGVLTMAYAPVSQVIVTNVTNTSNAAVDVRLAFLGWTRY